MPMRHNVLKLCRELIHVRAGPATNAKTGLVAELCVGRRLGLDLAGDVPGEGGHFQPEWTRRGG